MILYRFCLALSLHYKFIRVKIDLKKAFLGVFRGFASARCVLLFANPALKFNNNVEICSLIARARHGTIYISVGSGGNLGGQFLIDRFALSNLCKVSL